MATLSMQNGNPMIKVGVDNKQAKEGMRDIVKEFKNTRQANKDMTAAGKQEAIKFNRSIRSIRNNFVGLGTAIKGVTGLTRKLGGLLTGRLALGITAGTAAILGFSAKATLSMEKYRIQIQGATNDWDKTNTAIDRVRQNSFRLGRDLETSISTYSNILPTLTPQLGVEGATRLFEQAQIIATGKDMSTGDTTSFMDTIARVYSQGQFDSRVWTQFQRVIGDMEPFAKALGLSVTELKTAKVGIDEFNMALHALAVDQLDEATNVVGSTNSAFRMLKSSLWDIGTSIGESGLVQGLADLARGFANFTQTEEFDTWLDDSVKLVRQVLLDIGSGILDFIDVMGSAYYQIKTMLGQGHPTQKAFNQLIRDRQTAVTGTRRQFGKGSDVEMDAINYYNRQFQEQFGVNLRGLRRTAGPSEATRFLQSTGQTLGIEITKGIREVLDRLRAVPTAEGGEISAGSAVQSTGGTGGTPGLTFIGGELPTTIATFGATTEETKTTFLGAFSEMSQGLSDFGSLAKQLANTGINGIGTAIDNLARTGKLSMRELLISFTADIAAMTAKFLIFKAITGLFGGGTASGGISYSWQPGAPDPKSDVYDISGHRAMGGNVMADKAYIVGDKGAERFVPSSNGRIIPNSKMHGDININIDARGADPESAANIRRSVAELPEAIRTTIMQMKAEGGREAATFGGYQ